MSSQYTFHRDTAHVLAELSCSPQPTSLAQTARSSDLRFLRGGGCVACHGLTFYEPLQAGARGHAPLRLAVVEKSQDPLEVEGSDALATVKVRLKPTGPGSLVSSPVGNTCWRRLNSKRAPAPRNGSRKFLFFTRDGQPPDFRDRHVRIAVSLDTVGPRNMQELRS